MTTATIPTTRTRSQQRIEFLGDVLVSACIGYWSREVSTTARGGLRVIDLDGASHDITLDTVARGLAAVAEGRANYCNLGYADTKTRIALLNRTNGVEGDYDAIDADYIVQIGTYGEVVWS